MLNYHIIRIVIIFNQNTKIQRNLLYVLLVKLLQCQETTFVKEGLGHHLVLKNDWT